MADGLKEKMNERHCHATWRLADCAAVGGF